MNPVQRLKNHMQISIYSLLLVIIGGVGILFSLTFDLFRDGASHFGIRQFAGFVISSIVALAGLNRLAALRSRALDFILFGAYFAGILFMGLRPKYDRVVGQNGFLEPSGFSAFDFIINIIGFIPLSYLMMLSLFALNRALKKASLSVLVLVSCTGISFLIEVLQHFIAGRSSSLYDIMANGIGALIGITYYLFEYRTSPGFNMPKRLRG
jgi:VanZ family protein